MVEFNHAKKKIVVSSDFLKKSKQVGKEAEELSKALTLFPGYTLTTKRTAKGRTAPKYADMLKRLSAKGLEKEHEKFLELTDKKTNYFEVLKWYEGLNLKSK